MTADSLLTNSRSTSNSAVSASCKVSSNSTSMRQVYSGLADEASGRCWDESWFSIAGGRTCRLHFIVRIPARPRMRGSPIRHLVFRHLGIGFFIGVGLAVITFVSNRMPFMIHGNAGNPTLFGMLLVAAELLAASPWWLFDSRVADHLEPFLVFNGTAVGLISGLATVSFALLKRRRQQPK